MRIKQIARVFVLSFLTYGLCAVAQDSPMTNITGGGTKGDIPLFTGTHKIGNSNISQDSSGNEHFGAGIDATGAISSSSDVDAGGNVNLSGYVDAAGQVYSANSVYSSGYVYGASYLEAGTGLYGEYVDVDAPSGEAVYAYANDGSQVVQGLQYASPSSSAFEYAYFNNSSGAVIWGDSLGDTVAVGSKSAAVPLKNGKMVKVYSQESPQVWFEDFGTAQLVGGVVTVKLESKYAQLVDTKMPYHVFVTPNGDCHGLYIAQKNRNSFEVRELGGGQSSVSFDYRISALRNGYENVRLEPTAMPRTGKAPAHAAAHSVANR